MSGEGQRHKLETARETSRLVCKGGGASEYSPPRVPGGYLPQKVRQQLFVSAALDVSVVTSRSSLRPTCFLQRLNQTQARYSVKWDKLKRRRRLILSGCDRYLEPCGFTAGLTDSFSAAVSFTCAWTRGRGGGRSGVNKWTCQPPSCLNRLSSLVGECQAGPPW